MYRRCAQFGFDREKIERRLAFLRLSKSDHALAKRLTHEVITPNVDKIVNRFYDTLLFQSETRKWIRSGELIDRLKNTQRDYLLSLGAQFDSNEYFENRLQIGIMHTVVDLPLSIYQCAYSHLIRYIIDAFPDSILNNSKDYNNLTEFLIKISSLDMSLAIEAYHLSYLSVMEDEITMGRIREASLKDRAETDALTGLLNRNSAFLLLEDAIRDACENSNSLAILMLDIDYFKNINDTYGHQVGDEVLKQVTTAFNKSLREHDIVGRYGGEEFIIGLLDVSPEVATKIAERIRSSIADMPIKVADQIINISASIGLACLNQNDNLDSLVKRADHALLNAKKLGRNHVTVG